MVKRDRYVYMLIREDGTPFYVGKGSGNRMFDHERKTSCGRSATHKDHIIAKMKAAGAEVRKQKIAEGLTDEEAFAIEIEAIRLIGRLPHGMLVNATDGGEGARNLSPESRARISAAHVGNKYCLGRLHSDATKQKIRDTKKQNPYKHPESIIEKLSQSATGRRLSGPAKKKISEALIGKKKSQKTRELMARAKFKENLSPDTIAKRIVKTTGQKRTPEQRERMRVARLRYLESKASESIA